MSIKFFSDEESPTGKAGYRVTLRIGGKSHYKFFPSKQSELLARQQAMRQEAEWKHASRLAKAARALVPRYKGHKTVIVKNFRAVLYFCRRNSLKEGGSDLTYCYPEFAVTYSPPSGQQKQERFRIDKHGFDKAFELAANRYTEVFDLSYAQESELWRRKPTRAMFTGELYDDLVERRGTQFKLPSRKDIEEMLK